MPFAGLSMPCRSMLIPVFRAACSIPGFLLAGMIIVSSSATSAFCAGDASPDAGKDAALSVPSVQASALASASGAPSASSASGSSDSSGTAFLTEEYVAPGYPLYGDEQVFAGLALDGQDAPAAQDRLASGTAKTSQKVQAKEMQDLLDLDASKARAYQARQDPDREEGSEDGNTATLTLRERMVRDAARTISFQKAVALRYQELNKACEDKADLLGSIFSFSSLLIDGHILPPVLGFAGPVHTLHDADSASSVDETYTIRSQARLVSTAPSWRDYLTQHFDALEIRPECLPKNSRERSIWQDAVRSGWSAGTAQAEEVFQQNMDRLCADYRGMLRFTMLHKRGLVSLPVMARGHIPIKVGKTTLDINQTVFRLTRQSLFQNPEDIQNSQNSKHHGGDAANAKDRRRKPKNHKQAQ